MTIKINADTSTGLELESDTSGVIDIQSGGTTKMTVGTTIDVQGNELVLDADADTSIHADTDDQIDFKTAGTDKMSITSTDITAPEGINVKLHGSGTAGTQAGLWLRDLPRVTNDTSTFEHTYINSNNSLIFTKGSSATTSSNTEYERIISTGKHLFGSTSAESTSSDNMQIDCPNGSIYMYQNTTALQGVLDFRNPNGYIGSIRTTGSSTQFNTSSDYRLKENVNYTFDATAEIKRLKPCKFNFIADADTTLEGFLAHEVADVVPHAVSGEKDATKLQNIYDENSNVTGTETVPDYQQIDQSKLVPLLVKTIQELEQRITDLESE